MTRSRTLRYSTRQELPFDISRLPQDMPLLFDTTVYIDHLKGRIADLTRFSDVSRTIFHDFTARRLLPNSP
jgi:hypothetical protein